MDNGTSSVEDMVMDLSFYHGRRVLLTGHTGFKGAWLCKILQHLGAQVAGYSLMPPTTPNLFSLCNYGEQFISKIGDIRDLSNLYSLFIDFQPEIVLHLAAQPIVRESYENPHYTYEVNVMGTVNILECVRRCASVKSFLNVTTDKVYENQEWEWGYRENEPLDGFDPYSNSKSCSELVTHSYKNSFFQDGRVAISTARAGNVIGGGDFAKDRIIPDCVRAAQEKHCITVRNPNSIRPYQHVLEPLFAYLMIAEKQYENISFSGYYNVGPDECDCVTTGYLVNCFCKHWGHGQSWESVEIDGPHEANFLKLDCSKIKKAFQWKPRWGIDDAVRKTVSFSQAYLECRDVNAILEKQINEFESFKI